MEIDTIVLPIVCPSQAPEGVVRAQYVSGLLQVCQYVYVHVLFLACIPSCKKIKTRFPKARLATTTKRRESVPTYSCLPAYLPAQLTDSLDESRPLRRRSV